MSERLTSKRRAFLRQLAQLGIAVPFLPSIGSLAFASGNVRRPKRLIVVFSGCGQQADHWYPTRSLPLRQLSASCKGIEISAIDGPFSRVFDDKFNLYKSDFSIVRGLDVVPHFGVRDHWPMKTLSGYGTQFNLHQTIDQIICRSEAVYQSEPLVRSLHLKVRGSPEVEAGYLSYVKKGDLVLPNIPIPSPRIAAQRLFQPVRVDARILNHVRSAYSNIANHDALSGEDRQRLRFHLDYLADLDRRIGTGGQSTECTGFEIPEVADGLSQVDDYINLIASAVKCDLTRVILFNMTECADGKSYASLGASATEGLHALTHSTANPSSFDQLRIIENWHASKVLSLIQKLKEVEDPESGATYLDNSIIYWGNELGVKTNSSHFFNGHVSEDMPVFLAGGGGGALKQGMYLDYRNATLRKRWPTSATNDNRDSPFCRGPVCEYDDNFPLIGKPYNELLITLLTSMGLSPAEWESGGERGFGDYSQNYYDSYDLGDRRSPLADLIRTV